MDSRNREISIIEANAINWGMPFSFSCKCPLIVMYGEYLRFELSSGYTGLADDGL